jgi:hypothetical protein
MNFQDGISRPRLSDQVVHLLERVEYRRAESLEDKDAIYRLRHEAYVREGAIEPRPSGRFSDSYDDVPNVWIIGMFVDGELASSMRLHVAAGEDAPLPANAVFPDILGPRLRQGQILIDPTRFVTRLEISRRIRHMPYLTMRLCRMAVDFFRADFLLATIRAEHCGYYEHAFGHELWSEAREYPGLKKPIACMGLDCFAILDRNLQQYPFYRSTAIERAVLFGRSSNPSTTRDFKIVPLNSKTPVPV